MIQIPHRTGGETTGDSRSKENPAGATRRVRKAKQETPLRPGFAFQYSDYPVPTRPNANEESYHG